MPSNWTAIIAAGLIAFAAGTAFAQSILVDDDGAQCPDADFNTIQAAVAAADPGAKIEVCEGTYTGTVTITKDDIELRAKGPREKVILEGVDLTGNGFYLDGVSGVLVEGFTVVNFREKIRLVGADNNIIRGNATIGPGGHDGIRLDRSNGNLIEDNISIENGSGNGCGIDLLAGSSDNIVRHNLSLLNEKAGIRLKGAGTGNIVTDNEAYVNGFGIQNEATDGTVIEDNQALGNARAGIQVKTSTGVTVVKNLALGNDPDILWDESRANVFPKNRCQTTNPTGLCFQNDD